MSLTTISNGPGNVPDADVLMANFNYILGSPTFTGTPTVSVNASSTMVFNNTGTRGALIYFQNAGATKAWYGCEGALLGNNSFNATIYAGAGLGINFYVNDTAATAVFAARSSDGAISLKGTATNDAAAAGFYGEPIRSSVSSGVSSPGTGQFFDVTHIDLTAGDWDISGLVVFTTNGATQTVALMAITATSGNSVTGQTDGDNRCAVTVPTSANDSSGSIPCFRVSLSGSASYYLKARCDFSAGTPKAFGRISARRVR